MSRRSGLRSTTPVAARKTDQDRRVKPARGTARPSSELARMLLRHMPVSCPPCPYIRRRVVLPPAARERPHGMRTTHAPATRRWTHQAHPKPRRSPQLLRDALEHPHRPVTHRLQLTQRGEVLRPRVRRLPLAVERRRQPGSTVVVIAHVHGTASYRRSRSAGVLLRSTHHLGRRHPASPSGPEDSAYVSSPPRGRRRGARD